uniref:Tudor domain containing 7 a n=1 Tax=Hippocampus comes TaxID=109280 RepID=A0A3Q3EBN0_HIPCM
LLSMSTSPSRKLIWLGIPFTQSTLYDKTVVQRRLIQLLKKYCSGLWISKLPTVFSEMFKQQLPPQALNDLEKWTDVCMVEKSCSTKGDFLVYPPLPSSSAPQSSLSEGPAKPSVNLSTICTLDSSQVSTSDPRVGSIETVANPALTLASQPTDYFTSLEVPQKLGNSLAVTPDVNLEQTAHPLELLSKYTNGLWVHALPKLFLDNMDVYVPAACHPGYFVLQPWQDLHKLVVLMGQMMLYYNQTVTTTTGQIKKGDIYAAKIGKNWYRAVVKGILSNGLISIYELDHGKHELMRSSFLRPLIEEFRQLPFQAIIAQLAGKPTFFSFCETTSLVFRNHVEKQALVAQIENIQDESDVPEELWERKLTVYLVDTKVDDKDLWIHTLMGDMCSEPSSPT